MWMQIVGWRLEANARMAKAKPIDQDAECLDGILGLRATPADYLIRQGVFDELSPAT
jgi:hypothetical protein